MDFRKNEQTNKRTNEQRREPKENRRGCGWVFRGGAFFRERVCGNLRGGGGVPFFFWNMGGYYGKGGGGGRISGIWIRIG